MVTLAVLTLLAGAEWKFDVEVAAGKVDRVNEPIRVPLNLPAGKSYRSRAKIDGYDGIVRTLVTTPSLASAGKETAELWFVLPKLEAGKTAKVTLNIEDGGETGGTISWKHDKTQTTLMNGERAVLRYEHAPLDPTNREATFKVYHHAYSPEGVLLTKGVGGQFTHHRGLFYGFMKVGYDKNTVDIWHCRGQTHQAHREILAETKTNTLMGRHRVKIDWNGVEGKTFAVEEREVAAFPMGEGTLIEFTSRLTPTESDVKLDGDPQHAGFHFRASNDVAEKTKNQTIYIRPDGVGKPGTEVNWDGKKNTSHKNLPWLAMSFVLGDARYTAAYLDLPTNPKEARFSERTYGRFGSYFVTTVTKDKPLTVRYRVWLQKGQMEPEAVAALSKAFVEPAGVKVKE